MGRARVPQAHHRLGAGALLRDHLRRPMTSKLAATDRDDVQRTISPVDGRLYAERRLAGESEIGTALTRAASAQQEWQRQQVDARARQLSAFVDAFVAGRDEIALELTWQMGRPIRYTPGE